MSKQNILDKKYNFLRPIKTNSLIRLGPEVDGGYIVDSNIINNTDILIVFGLGDGSHLPHQWSFELDFIERNKNLSIYIYDYTVSSSPYIKKIWKYLRRFLTFRGSLEALKIRIRNYQNYLKFIKLNNVKFYKERIIFPIKDKIDTDIDKVFSRIKDNSEVIVKCDIAGSEYGINFDQILKHSNRIKMLIFEFHWLDKNEDLFIGLVKKLKSKFEIIHIHGNNNCQTLENGLPVVFEITLLNKKFVSSEIEYVNDFPIKDLDFPNNPHLKDIEFSFNG